MTNKNKFCFDSRIMKLGMSLKELVGRSPYTVTTITKKAGISRTAFYDYVRERFTPSVEVLGRILDALEVDDKLRATLMSLRDARDRKLVKAQKLKQAVLDTMTDEDFLTELTARNWREDYNLGLLARNWHSAKVHQRNDL